MPTQTGDTAPDQVARLLALVPYLLARGEVRLEEAAAHFGTDADQIERDLVGRGVAGLGGHRASPEPATARSRATTSSRRDCGATTTTSAP